MTKEQQRAIAELNEIAQCSNGSLHVVQVTEEHGTVTVELKVDCRKYEKVGANPLPLLDQENFKIDLGTAHPFAVPTVHVDHHRFAGYPHFQWYNSTTMLPSVCLYLASDVEWSPAEGMVGLIGRLDEWLAAGSKTQLDPDGAPIHPPVVYPNYDLPYWILSSADTPELKDSKWSGFFEFRKFNSTYYEIVRYMETPEAAEGNGFGAAVFVGGPMSVEFPDTLARLLEQLVAAGFDGDVLLGNIDKTIKAFKAPLPTLVAIGTPMRGISGTIKKKMHLAVWAFGESNSEGKISWCSVEENRKEILVRRDEDTSAVALRAKKILLLGVGGLGSSVADALVRSGAGKLAMVDKGLIRPGLILRQKFDRSDIGESKAKVTKKRLSDISESCEIEAYHENAVSFLDSVDLSQFDAVLDLTASNKVASKLERVWKAKKSTFFAAAVTGPESKQLLSVFSAGGFDGGPIHLFRGLHLKLMTDPKLKALALLIWPQNSHRLSFQAEPGCSEPTFVGSAADIGLLATYFVKELAVFLAGGEMKRAGYAGIYEDNGLLGSFRFLGEPTSSYVEKLDSVEIRVSPVAKAGLSAEISRSARKRGKEVETGGLIFGQIDNSLGIVWIDSISGAPLDSVFMSTEFVIGTKGVDEMVGSVVERSNRQSGFIGYWHTHPEGPATLSRRDWASAQSVIKRKKGNVRQTLMLVVDPSREDFGFYLVDRLNQSKLGWFS